MIRLIFFSLLISISFSQREYSIAVIADDITKQSLEINQLLKDEINSILGNRAKAVFKPEYQLRSNWSNEVIQTHLNNLNQKKDVDLILAVGAFTSASVGRFKTFPKPVILVGVYDSETQGIPYQNGSSGVQNMTYVRFADRLVERLNQFYNIYPFRRLGFLYDKRMIPFVNLKRTEINSFFLSKDASFKIIEFDGKLSTDEQLSGVDAVFFGDLRWISETDKKSMYERTNRLKLPSFTQNPQDVSNGAFASTANSELVPKIIRRISLLVESAFSKEDLSKQNVDIEFELEYQINFATSRAINISPPYDILIEAKLYGLDDLTDDGLSLEQVIQQALEKNRNLMASKLNISVQKKELSQSNSNLYPQLNSSVQAVQIDEKRATASQGSTAERTSSLNLKLEQVLYSDAIYTNKRIQEILLESEKANLESEIFDLVKTVGDLYYDALKLKSFFDIQRENVDVIKQNLSLAKIRLKTGFSDVSDVYRWESQLAAARQEMLDAINNLNQLKRSISLLIDRPIENEFNVDASNLDSIYAIYNNPLFTQFMDNPNSYEKMINYFVEIGLENAPELKQINLSKQIQERIISSKKREHFLPTFALGGDYSNTLSRSGAGVIPGIEPPNNNWSIALNLSLPLFNGFSTVIDQEIAEIQQNQLEFQSSFLTQQIKVDIHNQFQSLKINQVKINLSDRAADFAEKSLKLIQESYAKGQVSVIELLDAQNTYIKAKSAASSSLYDYLKSILGVERSISRFLFLNDQSEQEKFRARFIQFIQSNGKKEN